MQQWRRDELARTVGVVVQREEPAFPVTVGETVAMGRYAHVGRWRRPRARRPRGRRAARSTRADVAGLRDRLVQTLSGGEWQRVRVARALAQEPRALVLDEPTASLDLRHEMELFELVAGLVRERGLAALVVSHHLNVAARFADRLVLVHGGRVVADDVPERVLEPARLAAVFGWPVAVHRLPDGAVQLYPERRPVVPGSPAMTAPRPPAAAPDRRRRSPPRRSRAPRRCARSSRGDTIVLDEIVVTATRLPLPRAAVASAVTVLTGDALRARGDHDPARCAARRARARRWCRAGSYGTPASFFLRGGESDYVRVLVDGVPVNEPGRGVRLRAPDAGQRGPHRDRPRPRQRAVRVGRRDGRRAGVHARRPSAPPAGASPADGGSYGTARVAAEAAGGGAPLGFSVVRVALRGRRDVRRSTAAYRRRELSALVRPRPAPRRTRGSPSASTITARALPDGRRRPPVDHNQFTTGRQATLGLDVRHALSAALELRALVGAHAGQAGYDDRPDGPADSLGYFADVSRQPRRAAERRSAGRRPPRARHHALRRRDARAADGDEPRQRGEPVGPVGLRARSGARQRGALRAAGRGSRRTPGGQPRRAARPQSAVRLVRDLAGGGLVAPGAARAGARRRGHRAQGAHLLRDVRERVGHGQRRAPAGALAQLGDRRRRRALGAAPPSPLTAFVQRFADLIQYTFTPPAPGRAELLQRRGGAIVRPRDRAVGRPRAGPHGARALHLPFHGRARTPASRRLPDGAFAAGPPAAAPARPRRRRRGRMVARRAAACRRRWTLVGRRDDMDYAGAAPVRVRQPAYARIDVAGSAPVLGRGGATGLVATVRVENLLGARYQEVRGFPARGRTVLVGLRAEGGF